MTTAEAILTALAIGEDDDWEFKSARGGFPGSFWETYSAMANGEGGTVVLGVTEKQRVHTIDGLSLAQIDAAKKVLWDGVHNRGIVSVNLLSAGNVTEQSLDGKTVLSIRIPRATREQRPVHKGLNPLGGTFKRSHEGDYQCTDPETRRMLADADQTGADQRILGGFGLKELDRPSIDQYRQRMRAGRPEHPWLVLDDQGLLTQLGGWRVEKATGLGGLTLAGLMMFGKDVPIRDPEAAPEYFVDYREKLDPALRWTDRIYPDGTWEANLFQFYIRVLPKLTAALPTPFAMEGGVRKDFTPAHEALREAFVNAMIHADYTVGGGVVVERYPDRIVLENPGTLLVSLEQYHLGGVSECRNKAIQRMFLMIGGGEQAGSGAEKIRHGWRSNAWRTPWIRATVKPDRVRLTLPMVSLVPGETMRDLRDRFGALLDTLDKDELQALATAQLEGSVTNGRLRSLTTLHTADVSALFKRLCEQRMLVSDGYGRGTTYSLPTAGAPASHSSPLPAHSSLLTSSSSLLGTNSSPLASGPPESNTNNQQLLWDGQLGGTLPSGQLDPESAMLRMLADPLATKGKWSAGEGERGILAMCRGRFLTADQLAQYLGRNADSLRNKVLSPMVKSGTLRLRHPEVPNSPNQAYTAGDDQ